MIRPVLRGLLSALALGAAVAPLPAQVLQLDRPRLEVGADLDGSWFSYPQAPSSTLGTFREWFGIGIGGGIPHPGLFGFTATFYPRWTQQRRTEQLLDTTQTASGTWIDYRMGASLLAALPASISGWAQRTSGTEPDVFSGPRDYDVREFGGRFTLRSAYTPVRVEYIDRSLEETWFPDGRDVLIRDERLRTLRADARTRTITLYGERLDLEERRDGRDFVSYLGNAAHELRWGWGSSIRSAVRYYDRTGFLPQQRLSWSEFLHLQHVPTVGTDWHYEQSWIEAGGGRQRYRAAGVQLTVDPSPVLRLGAEGRGQWSRFPTGLRDEYVATPHVLLSVPLASQIQFTARASVGYEWQRLEPTADGLVDVVNELHVVDASGRFTLREPFADPLTVVVANSGETLVFQEDLDYRVVPLGDLLDVLVLPTGRIQTGDTVLVDYRYRLVPAARASGLLASYGADLRFHSVTAYARRQTRNLDSPDPVGPFVLDYDDFITGVSIRQRIGPGFVDLNGEYQRRELADDAFTTWAGRAHLSVPIGLGLRPSVGGRISRSESGGGAREFRTISGEAALEWMPTTAVRVRLRGNTFWWEDTPAVSERFWGAGLDAEFRTGRAQLQLLVDRGVWTEGFERETSRAVLRVRRRF